MIEFSVALAPLPKTGTSHTVRFWPLASLVAVR